MLVTYMQSKMQLPAIQMKQTDQNIEILCFDKEH